MKNISALLVATFCFAMSFAQAPTARQLSRMGLKDASATLVRNGIWKVSVGGKAKGHVVSSAPFATDVRGFRGATPVMIYFNGARKIEKIISLPNQETPEFFSRAEDLLLRWRGKKAASAAKLKVDAISGATYSSKGLIGNVKAAVEAYNKYVK